MVSSGMKDAGYQYVTMDDGWMSGKTNASGEMVPKANWYLNGIKALADYVHGKGLKLGVYATPGASSTPGGQMTMAPNELRYAQQFADWGVDYLKYTSVGICASRGNREG